MNNNDQISLNIKLARMSAGLNSKSMAQKLLIKESSYNHFENGRSVPVLILGMICETLKIKVDDVLFKKADINLTWK